MKTMDSGLTLSINTGGARMTGSGDALVQIDRAEPAGEARAAETVVRPQPVHTLGAVLTAVVLTIINVLLTKLPLKNKTFKKSKLLKRKSFDLIRT